MIEDIDSLFPDTDWDVEWDDGEILYIDDEEEDVQ